MPEAAILNGRLVSTRRAVISIDDWAVRYGWGLFETIRVRQGCPLFLDRHLSRLCHAAPLLKLSDKPEQDATRWTEDILHALETSNMREAVVNCYWTHGSPLTHIRQSRIVRIRRMPHYPQSSIRLWVAPWRLEPTYPGSGIKSMAYFPYIFGGIAARREQCDEALILNTSGRVADCAASSIFSITGERICTPALGEGALPGITRAIVLEIAGDLGVRALESRLTWNSTLDSDALLVASALRGVVPVNNISGHWVRPPGRTSIASRMCRAYAARVQLEVSSWRKES